MLLGAALAGLYWCLLGLRRPWGAALAALAYGLAQHAVGHGWIHTALRDKVGLSLPLSLFASAVFLLYLAAFMALATWAWARFFRPPSPDRIAVYPSAAALAALWTLGEWARGVAFTGFTSLSTGYALIDSPLGGWIPIGGMYGLGLGALALCFASVPVLEDLRARRWLPLGIVAGIVAATVAIGRWGTTMPWIEADGGALAVRLIQTGARQEDKFDRSRIPAEIARLTDHVAASPADLVLAPETAFPVFVHQLPPGVLDRLVAFAETSGTSVFIGVARMENGVDARNSVLQVGPGQAGLRLYDKEALMPFGEYSPTGFDWFSRRLPLPLKDLTPGTADQVPFTVQGRTGGILICHEDSQPRLARRRAQRSTFLLNPTNLAWFEESAAIPQALAMARTRALETGRPVLRAANTGVTAHIDHKGRVVASLPSGRFGILAGVMQPTRGTTPYVRHGDAPALIGCALVLVGVALQRRRLLGTSVSTAAPERRT